MIPVNANKYATPCSYHQLNVRPTLSLPKRSVINSIQIPSTYLKPTYSAMCHSIPIKS